MKIKQGVDIYYLKDQLQESIQGTFYSNKFQNVAADKNEEYEIEKKILTRKRIKRRKC